MESENKNSLEMAQQAKARLEDNLKDTISDFLSAKYLVQAVLLTITATFIAIVISAFTPLNTFVYFGVLFMSMVVIAGLIYLRISNQKGYTVDELAYLEGEILQYSQEIMPKVKLKLEGQAQEIQELTAKVERSEAEIFKAVSAQFKQRIADALHAKDLANTDLQTQKEKIRDLTDQLASYNKVLEEKRNLELVNRELKKVSEQQKAEIEDLQIEVKHRAQEMQIFENELQELPKLKKHIKNIEKTLKVKEKELSLSNKNLSESENVLSQFEGFDLQKTKEQLEELRKIEADTEAWKNARGTAKKLETEFESEVFKLVLKSLKHVK